MRHEPLWECIDDPTGHFELRGCIEEMVEPINRILAKTNHDKYFFHNGWEGDCLLRFPGVIDKLHAAMDNHDVEHITILYGDARAAEKYDGDRITFIPHIGWWQHENNEPMLDIKSNAKPFMSLNRTVHEHRLEHFRLLAELGLLKHGNVSAHLRTVNSNGDDWLKENPHLAHFYPRFVDGNNAARNTSAIIPRPLYERSQVNFITETKFAEESIFLSEKSWKPLALGQPFMVLATCGHLRLMRELGYRTDFSGLDQSYDLIADHSDRMLAAHRSLSAWCSLSQEERNQHMQANSEIIEHNRNHWEKTNHIKITICSI